MLDPTILKDNLEVLESNISRRNLKIDVNHLISLTKFKNIILKSPDGETLEAELELALNDFKITIFDIIDNEDFVIKYQNGNYSYERVIPDGTVKKPIEDLIQKNINKLFENLFQWS